MNWCLFQIGFSWCLFLITARKRSLGQGNIFRSVCHSICLWSRVPSRGSLSGGEVFLSGRSPDRELHTVKSGRYEYYWNVLFLFGSLLSPPFLVQVLRHHVDGTQVNPSWMSLLGLVEEDIGLWDDSGSKILVIEVLGHCVESEMNVKSWWILKPSFSWQEPW